MNKLCILRLILLYGIYPKYSEKQCRPRSDAEELEYTLFATHPDILDTFLDTLKGKMQPAPVVFLLTIPRQFFFICASVVPSLDLCCPYLFLMFLLLLISHHKMIIIMKTCLFNFIPLNPTFI